MGLQNVKFEPIVTTHEVVAYSVIYGQHPKEVDFAYGGAARRSSAPRPSRRSDSNPGMHVSVLRSHAPEMEYECISYITHRHRHCQLHFFIG